jgi:hypothetical protein
MNRRNICERTVALSTLAILFILPFVFRYWPTMVWATLGIVAIVITTFVANVLYALVSLELGYSTHDKNAKTLSNKFHHAPQRFKALFHSGMLRNR